MATPLFLVEGLFGQGEVHTDAGRVCLRSALEDWIGSRVEVHLHHLPLDPVDPSLPGGGSCMWNGFCPHGHRENPGWLFHQKASGILSGDPLQVGGEILRWDLMPGHRGRLFVLHLDFLKEPSRDKTVEDLTQEAAEMSDLLHRLRQVIK